MMWNSVRSIGVDQMIFYCLFEIAPTSLKFFIRNLKCVAKPSVSPPDANAPANLGSYRTKVHEIFIGRSDVIGGVSTHITVVILPSVVERTE